MDADARQITTEDVVTLSGSSFFFPAAAAGAAITTTAAVVSEMITASGSFYFSSAVAVGEIMAAAVSAANYDRPENRACFYMFTGRGLLVRFFSVYVIFHFSCAYSFTNKEACK